MSAFLHNLAARALGTADIVKPRLASRFGPPRAESFDMFDVFDTFDAVPAHRVPDERVPPHSEPPALHAEARTREAEVAPATELNRDTRSERIASPELRKQTGSEVRDESVAVQARSVTVPTYARSSAMPTGVEPDAEDGVAYRMDALRDGATLAHPMPPISQHSQQPNASQPVLPLAQPTITASSAQPPLDPTRDGDAHRSAVHEKAASKSTRLPLVARATDEPARHAQMSPGRTLSPADRARDDEAVPVTGQVDAEPERALPHATHRAASQHKPPVPLARRSADTEPPAHVAAVSRARPDSAGRPQNDAAPTVHVTIGRVEVRASPAPSNSRTKPARNTREPSPLDRYLKARAEGSGS
ncbi:hypothetical protein [Paraburkholderia sp. HP33-1]|uniref:hypothetical protein n=1 Tax=Paraburkholderia sp. HP33-1 TaxID=2883243 RepID=UPI001F3A184A|nr:hypothetical protein [Paraburkholderia sp. HP33-1]